MINPLVSDDHRESSFKTILRLKMQSWAFVVFGTEDEGFESPELGTFGIFEFFY